MHLNSNVIGLTNDLDAAFKASAERFPESSNKDGVSALAHLAAAVVVTVKAPPEAFIGEFAEALAAILAQKVPHAEEDCANCSDTKCPSHPSHAQ